MMSEEAATSTITQKETTQAGDVTQVDVTQEGEKGEKGKENEDQKEKGKEDEKGGKGDEKEEKEKGKGKGKGKNKKGAEEDEEEEEGGKKKKAKKGGGGGGEDHRMQFEIGEKRRVTVSEFKGGVYVDIREFYADKEDGSMKPGKKGISLKKDEWKMLCECAKKIDGVIANMEG